MKIKNLASFSAAALLLVLFGPVFGYTIFVGNKMNYNEIHKIEALYSNPILLLFALGALLLFVVLYILLDKIPLNRYTKTGTVLFCLFASVLFYVFKVESSKCIAFYGGWDCGSVANSARWLYEGEGIGSGDYYYIYSNNVPITWLLYVLYRFTSSWSGYPYTPEFIWIQFQCLMFAIAVFFSVMTVYMVSRKIAPTILTLLTSVVVLGLCPWQIIPYTDGSSIAFPVLVLFLYVAFRRVENKSRYLIWLLMVFAGVIGGILKATGYIALIAVLGVDFLWLLFGKESMISRLKKLGLRMALVVCGYVLAVWCRSGMYSDLDYVPDYDLQMTWSNYFYNGLNELTTGACSGDGLVIARAYAGYTRKFRQYIELHYAKDRILEKGLDGMIDFWLRKQVMNFNDGTFSWFQEGFFHAWDYPDITDSKWKEPLRDFYWQEGPDYKTFVTWSQGTWIFILTGILAEAFYVAISVWTKKQDTENRSVHTLIVVMFLGGFLFVMLFEGRARYLLNLVPVFITMAMFGFSETARGIEKLAARLRTKI